MVKLINWQCKCGVVYGLERLVPVVLHMKLPERKKCRKQISVNKKCGNPFPDQNKRDEMFHNQYGIIEDE